MKHILYIFVFISLLFTNAQAQNETLKYKTTYSDAIKTAKNTKKDALIFVYTSYCGWCTKMKNTTLKDPKIIKFINENYVFAMINKDNQNIPAKLNSPFVPTTFLIDFESQDVIQMLYGYKDSKSFMDEINLLY